MISDVRKIFNQELNALWISKPEVLRACNEHPNKAHCIENLCTEIVRAEKKRINFNAEKYRLLIAETVKLYSRAIIRLHEERAMTSGEKLRRIEAANKHSDADQFFDDLKKEALDQRTKVYMPGDK